jgi:hypothetical protein
MPEGDNQNTKPEKFAADSPWRDRKGIAAYYGKSVRTISEWKKKRVIPCIEKGGDLLFNIHDCDRALKAGYGRDCIALAE